MRRFLSDAAVDLMALLVLGSPFIVVSLPYAVSWQVNQEAKR
jgi:hypothetical protein